MTAMKCVPPQVIKGAEILEVLHSLPSVRQYLFSLYECRYSVFFQSLGEEPFSFIDLNHIEKLPQTYPSTYFAVCYLIYSHI